MEVLQAKDLRKIYGSGNNAVHALDGVDLSVQKGEFVAIVGTSGSGKSTLLHMLGGLDTPTSGSVILSDKDLYSMKEDQLAVFRRRKFRVLFQAFNLVSSINVWENIVLPLGLDGKKVHKAYVNDIITTLGLEHRIHNLPNTLSGGQQQRVLLARALCATENLLLLDEPVTGLDPVATAQFYQMIQQLNENGVAVIMISHDLRAIDCARHVLHMNHGGSFWGSREEYKNSRYWNIISVEYEKGGGQSAACR